MATEIIPTTMPNFSQARAMLLLPATLLAAMLTLCPFPVTAARGGDVVMAVRMATTESAYGGDAYGIIFGLFIGIMLAAAIYLLFIWIIIRDRGQVFLMLMLVCISVSMASTNSTMTDYLGLKDPTMLGLLQNYSMIMAYIFSIFFTWYFLDIEINAPALRGLLLFLAALLFLLLAYAAVDQGPVRFALPTLGALSVSVVLLAGLGTLRRGISGSLTHIAAFSFFMAGGLAEPLYDLGIISEAQTGNNLSYIAFSSAALIFAIVIAGQFAARQEEKERALAVSNERFALAARGANEGLFDWNILSGETFFSDQFRKMLGLSLDLEKEHGHGMVAWARMITASDRAAVLAALRKFRGNRRSAALSLEYRVESGNEKRWMHTKVVATRDESGKVSRLVGSVSDITARKNGEAALKASEIRFRSITEAHPVPIMIVRLADGEILYASPGAGSLLGAASRELLGRKLSLFWTDANERGETMSAIASGSEVNMREIAIFRADGAALSAALSARRINYQDETAAAIGLYDLTERKRAEEQISRQQEALQQSEKMAALGGLLAGVAHELNNPLSVVMGQSTLLVEGEGTPKIKSRAEKIFKAADRCSRIVKSFLAMARRKPPELRAVDLNAVVAASLELLGYHFRNGNVAVSLDMQHDLPNVRGDADHLTQVFTNLALNAVQAMQDWTGARKLTIRTDDSSDNKNEVVVLVSDTGPGIPPELRSRVFEPFFTTRGSGGGTGVGLALCLGIIETHGGKISIEETAGGGATFRIVLPTMAAAISKTVPSPASGKADGADLPSGLRLLLVDDEVELAQTLADLLEPEGHKITMAANGAVALEKLRQGEYDAIISDLRMPMMDGPTLYDELAKEFPRYLKRIAYVTGDTLSPRVNEFLSRVSVPVVEKPYRLVDVKEAIITMLAKV